jgi:hypothetical protein
MWARFYPWRDEQKLGFRKTPASTEFLQSSAGMSTGQERKWRLAGLGFADSGKSRRADF